MIGPIAALVACAALAGCGRTLQPRTSAPLSTEGWNAGALLDASRAYPVAFWADACVDPPARQVGPDELLAGQWLCHVARKMNEVVARAGLFDARFASVGSGVLGGAADAGHVVYPCNPEAVDGLRRASIRAVELRLIKAEPVQVVSDRGVAVSVAVQVGKTVLTYQVTSTLSSWDVEAFSRLGALILGDARFWQTVAGPF